MKTRPRILILRSDRIGDGVLFSGALAALRAHWPDARLELMVSPEVRPLFARCPHIDRLLSIDRLMPWDLWHRHFPRGGWALERLLLNDRWRRVWYPRYDIVIYPVSAPIEPVLRAVRLMDATEKWGYDGDQLRWTALEDDANRPDRVFTRRYVNRPEDRWMHEIDRTRAFLETMGVAAGPLAPELWVSASDRRYAARALPAKDALGFFVGAGSPRRQWPAAKWVALALAQTAARRLVLLGGRTDRAFADSLQRVLRGSGLAVHNLVGRTRVGELAACIQRCRAVVANDSSGLHLAVAAGVPAVGILGGYHFGRFYPWGDARIHRVAHVPMDCYHCNDDCRYGDWRCVSEVPVEGVCRELQQALTA